MTKAIIVHPNEDVHSWFTTIKPDWDTQVHVPSIAKVWDYLENGTLSEDSQVILVSDSLYEAEGDEYALMIAQFAPIALVIVITEDESLSASIRAAVDQQAEAYAFEKASYFFLNTALDANEELDRIIQEYRPHTPAPAAPASNHNAAPIEESITNTSQSVTEVENTNAFYSNEELSQISNNYGEPGMVISSTSSKGGSGKSTVGLCTAITLAMASRIAYEEGKAPAPLKVVVVDMDIRDGQIGFTLDQTSPTVMNYFVEGEKTLEGLQNYIIHFPRFEIDTLLAPKRGRTADYLSPEFYRDTIRKLRLLYDVIILDTSVNYLDPLLSKVVYPESDAILFVTNLSKGAVYGMPRWMEEVTASVDDYGAGVSKDKIGVVINQSMGQVGMDLDLLKRAAKGAPLLVSIPADSLAVVKASNTATLNELIAQNEKIGREYFTLATKVWKKTALSSPIENYLNSPEKQRDDALAARGKSASGVAKDTKPQAPKRRLFGK